MMSMEDHDSSKDGNRYFSFIIFRKKINNLFNVTMNFVDYCLSHNYLL